MMKWFSRIVISALVLVVTGCTSSGTAVQKLEVTAANMAFSEKEITVEKGKTVQLVLNNQDGLTHDFSIDKIPADVKKDSHGDHSAHDMGGKNPDLHVSSAARKQGTVAFTPTQVGTYTFYCAVPGHKEAGMVGTLTVK